MSQKVPEEKRERHNWKSHCGPEKRNLRRRLWYRFHKTFGAGHDTSLRPFAEWWADPKILESGRHLRYLEDVHPRAFNLIATHGIDYKPLLWRKPPEIEPIPGACFSNAWAFMRLVRKGLSAKDKDIQGPVYVEGFAFGLFVKPMLHAWNAPSLNSQEASDWTFYSTSRWTRYLGIPFTEAEREVAQRCIHPNSNEVSLLFRKRHFPKVESYLTELLEKRANET